jgi:hypothetical protein
MIPATTDVLLVRPGRPQQKDCRILVISYHSPPNPTIGAKWRHATKGQSDLRRDAYDCEELKAALLSKSAVSRVVGTLKAEVEAWRTRSLAVLDVLRLYLDAVALRVRSAGKVVSVPALGVVAVAARVLPQRSYRPPASCPIRHP